MRVMIEVPDDFGSYETVHLTEREILCLRYLDDKMEANASMIGEALVGKVHGGGSNYQAVGSNVVGALRRRGLVLRISDLNAWRISRKGRSALAMLDVEAGEWVGE